MVKEVRQVRINAKVTAHPFTGGWAVECSECGPLAVATPETVDAACTAHMASHGAQTVVRS